VWPSCWPTGQNRCQPALPEGHHSALARRVLTVVRIAGDGVGPELVAAGSRLMEMLCPVRWIDRDAGLGAMAVHGTTAPAATIEAIRQHGVAIKGPFATPNGGDVRSANYYLRRQLDLYACLRPIPIDPARPLLLVRENVEDLYGAIEWAPDEETAYAAKVATRMGCRRVAEYTFALAREHHRKLVTVVHKANNLKLTEGMFLDAAFEIAREFPDIEVEEMLADTACAHFVIDPGHFDVVLTSNTFGDLLSSLGAAVAGSLGLVGSLNSGHGRYVAEAGHGDAGSLAGLDRVNPVGFLDSVRLLLAATGHLAEADAVGHALIDVLAHGPRTLDLGGVARTSDVVDFVCARAQQQQGAPRG
jgi:isocitrate dehydrogenase (NAD+)